MAEPKIAIVGAGLGGLTVARLLQKNDISCTLYEGEKDRHVRNQGGSLDLHPEAGQRALREAGLFEEFQKYSRPEDQCDKLVGADGTVLWNENDIEEGLRPEEMGDRPEIDRQELRDILMDSIEPNSIKWGRHITRVEADPHDKLKSTIHFTDGSKETGIDLLIGSDGGWSKVRPMVTDEQPYYSGITAIELWASDVENKHPWLSKYVGRGTVFMFDEGRAIIAQRNSNNRIRVYACVRQPETWKDDCSIDWLDHDAAREAMVRMHFSDCYEDIKRLVLDTNEELVLRQMYMLPVGTHWQTRPGVTLVGDAASLMTPFAGVGVNVAMGGALMLTRALISRKDELKVDSSDDNRALTAAVEEYERSMFAFAKKNQEATAHGLKKHFSKDGGEERARKFIRFYEEKIGRKYVPLQ